ncbi:MAG: hypothetical protein ACFFCW_49880 [Candidatus Hodarchaeota archaeon]
MSNSIPSCVTRCINSFIKLFQKNACDFLYEEEIRAILYAQVRDALAGESVRLPVVIYRDEISKDFVQIGIVRAEYPSPPPGRGRIGKFDIAIIHPDSKIPKREGDRPRWESFWNQDLLGAIEIKYCQIGEKLTYKISDLIGDMNKLQDYKNPEDQDRFEFGLALLFLQQDHLSIDPVTERLKTEEVSKVGLVSGIEAYVITPETKYKVIDVPQT